MKPLTRTIALAALTVGILACTTGPKADYPAAPVPFTDVHLTDVFWAPRLETNRTVTIPHIFKESEQTGRVKNFELADAALGGATDGKFCTRYPFDDSDVYKIIEAASYALATPSSKSKSTGSSRRSPPPRSPTVTFTRRERSAARRLSPGWERSAGRIST
jgi:hypothetical protein